MAVEVESQAKTDATRLGLRTLFDDAAGNTRGKVVGIYSFLLVFNAAAWLWAVENSPSAVPAGPAS